MNAIKLPLDAVLPPPIPRPTQRPTEKGRRQKLWDQGFEIEQMASEYARGDALDIIAERWGISQPTARLYIVMAGGKIRPASSGLMPDNRNGLRFGPSRKGAKMQLCESERKRRATQARINAATRAQNNRDSLSLKNIFEIPVESS